MPTETYKLVGGLGVRVQGLGFGVCGVYRIYRVQGFGFIRLLGFRVSGSRRGAGKLHHSGRIRVLWDLATWTALDCTNKALDLKP